MRENIQRKMNVRTDKHYDVNYEGEHVGISKNI